MTHLPFAGPVELLDDEEYAGDDEPLPEVRRVQDEQDPIEDVEAVRPPEDLEVAALAHPLHGAHHDHDEHGNERHACGWGWVFRLLCLYTNYYSI